jgi:opacity protein-like surface antigen
MSSAKIAALSLALVLTIVLCIPLRSSASESDTWSWKLTPYIWATDLTGDVQAQGTESEVSAGFGDILELLNFGVMGVFEGRRGRWIVASELFAAELGDEFDTRVRSLGVGGGMASIGPGEVEVTSQLGFLDLRAGYTVLARGRIPIVVDLLAGARIWYSSIDIDVDIPTSVSGSVLPGDRLPGFELSGVQFPAGLMPTGLDRDFEESEAWIDPVVGVRLSYELRPHVSLLLVSDVSGFGIGSASDLTWNAALTLDYRLSERWTLRAGYRGLNLDRDAGLDLDLSYHGPIVGVAYTFGD